jgi:hypothetical protein
MSIYFDYVSFSNTIASASKESVSLARKVCHECYVYFDAFVTGKSFLTTRAEHVHDAKIKTCLERLNEAIPKAGSLGYPANIYEVSLCIKICKDLIEAGRAHAESSFLSIHKVEFIGCIKDHEKAIDDACEALLFSARNKKEALTPGRKTVELSIQVAFDDAGKPVCKHNGLGFKCQALRPKQYNDLGDLVHYCGLGLLSQRPLRETSETLGIVRPNKACPLHASNIKVSSKD